MRRLLNYPFDPFVILKKKKEIRRRIIEEASAASPSYFQPLPVKIAILGGSTTAEIKDILDLFLLKFGIHASFYESAYNKFYEEGAFPNPRLSEFAPDIIYVHTTKMNITSFPGIHDSREAADGKLREQMGHFVTLWEALRSTYGATVIQNNFELPSHRIYGNLDFADYRGKVNFVSRLNMEFATYASEKDRFYIHDLNYLSACFGLEKWHDKTFWHTYKYAMCYEAIPHIAHNLSNMIKALYGRSRRAAVLDLDNTLWGGEVGDDGAEHIRIGPDTPLGEAHTAFQLYLGDLNARGVLLTIASKNDPAIAAEGLKHPGNVLRPENYSAVRANFAPKDGNIMEISREINISPEMMVFIDDNPAERALVEAQISGIAVPDIGADATRYIRFIDREGYFEPASLHEDDLHRSSYYLKNAEREDHRQKFTSYEDYLASLAMKAEITHFRKNALERIHQLVHKTNQFNLTGQKYSTSKLNEVMSDKGHICLQARLTDVFGDNGLVSVLIGSIKDNGLHIDLWLMSCRVLNRALEQAMLDVLIHHAIGKGIKTLWGYYTPTARNRLVAGFYQSIGFQPVDSGSPVNAVWQFDLTEGYNAKNTLIKVTHD
ncbi:MAG: HAD-IIIC family phosphatase [Nitrospinae bacterium]|nr:HAD-IIIC family phosphatase [Nitrospinota bacterium]